MISRRRVNISASISIAAARAEEARPSLIRVRSTIAWGAPNKANTAGAHGAPLGEDEVRAAKEAYGWDPDKHFYVPDEVYTHMNAVERGNALESEWQQRFANWSQATTPTLFIC